MTETPSYIPGSVKTLACPNCGGIINIRAVGITVTAICGNCGSTIDINNPELRIIQKAHEATKLDLDLPLGSRGHLFGHEWEVIGYMERATEDNYRWSEYLLFNPWQGFRFLVEDNGHWNFVKMLRQQIDDHFHSLSFNGENYKLYNTGTAKVTYVLGEFYWRVKVGEKAITHDYIAPPYMLSKEQSDQDVVWSIASYISPSIIQEAFQIKASWPAPTGIAPNQPCSAQKHLQGLYAITAIAFICLFITQIITTNHAKEQILINSPVQTTPAQKDTPLTTDEFEIPERTGNLEIKVSSPVDNNWLEVDAQLVNQTTQEKDEALDALEYYHGYDSDGYWSEGSRTHEDILSAVPGGKYRLLLTADAGAFTQSPLSPVADPQRTSDPLSIRAQNLSSNLLNLYNASSSQEERTALNRADTTLSHIRWEYTYNHLSADRLKDLLQQLEDKIALHILTQNQETAWETQASQVINENHIQNPNATPTVTYQITVTRNVEIWSNFLVALLLVLIWPLSLTWYKQSFEKRRWAESSVD